MIRVYCDSNVFRLLKPSSKQFDQAIFSSFESIRKNAVMAFSEAHLDDLRSSKVEYRNEDLELMEKYTGDFYIFYNQISKNWDSFLATPIEAYKDRNYDAYDLALSNSFNFRSLIADIEDFPGKEELCVLMDNFMQTPISAFGLQKILATDADGSKNILEKIVPGYDPNMGIGDFFKNMNPYISKLMSDYKEFDELRRNITSYVDTNDYKYNKWGLAFDEQLEKTAIGRKFTDIIRQLNSGGEKDDWRQFQQAYAMLEMMGITEERVGGKRKRNNLADLTKDCAHAFNAMSCDYFITNDKGLLVKAQILYHIFQVDRTRIIMLDELDHFKLAQSVDDPLSNLISFISSLPLTFDGKSGMRNYSLENEFLHYFDLVSIINGHEKEFILRASKDEGKSFMYREILKVCEKAVQLLGNDVYGRGLVELRELNFTEPTSSLRVWNFNDIFINLMCGLGSMTLCIIVTLK